MKKELKDTIIVELGEKLKEFPHFYLVDLTGLDAAKTSELRGKCFKNEIKLLMVKNTLLQKAFEASEIDFTPLYECLKGNTAIMFTQTANVPAKLLKDYKKEGIPALKGAYAEESFFVGADKLDELLNKMADIKAIAEELVNLTVKEVNELATVLKDEYGIEPAAAAVAVAAGPAAAGAAEAAEEKTSFDEGG